MAMPKCPVETGASSIDPALIEVNALTPYDVALEPRLEERKAVGFILGWGMKDEAGMRDAYAEMQRPRIGRRERLNKMEETHVIIDD